jgi:hypothetical protein
MNWPQRARYILTVDLSLWCVILAVYLVLR